MEKIKAGYRANLKRNYAFEACILLSTRNGVIAKKMDPIRKHDLAEVVTWRNSLFGLNDALTAFFKTLMVGKAYFNRRQQVPVS